MGALAGVGAAKSGEEGSQALLGGIEGGLLASGIKLVENYYH